MVDINVLIGKRLAKLVKPAERDAFIERMGWESQTYYEARIGRRIFRVAELASMARASGGQVWQFVDARGLSRSVTLGAASTSTISAAELVDLFQAPGQARWRLNAAVKTLKSLSDRLGGSAPEEGSMAHQLVQVARLIKAELEEAK